MKASYQDHLKRMIRSYEKLPDQPISEEISDEMKDSYFNFFEICYELKDWIKNDPVVIKKYPNIEKEVEDYISQNQHLRIVSGMANVTKHKRLKYKQRRGIGKYVRPDILAIGDGGSIVISYGIARNRKSILAHSLAINAMKEWKVFLLNHGLANFSFDQRISSLFGK